MIERNAEKSIALANIARRFEFIECKVCHIIKSLGHFNQIELLQWQFDLMGLLPSVLGVCKAICPTCQEMMKDFMKVI